MPHKTESPESEDAARWDAVEEASELLVEGQIQEALTALRAVLQADPKNAYAYNLVGTAFWELRQFEPARDAFNAAILVSPDFLGARLGLSHALRKLGEVPAAIRQARMALQRHPDDGEAHHALGLAYAERGDDDLAIKSLERFLESKPEAEVAMEVRQVLARLRGPAGGDDDDDDDDDE